MIVDVLTESQFEQAAAEVRQVLGKIGFHLGHERLRALALQAGCAETAQGRVVFDGRQIDEMRERIRELFPPPPAGAPEPRLVHPKRPLRTGLGNIVPKVYDYETRSAVAADTDHLSALTKLAHAEQRVASLCIPLSRQDVPPPIEQLDALVLMARLTDKPVGSVDPTVPEAVPYIAEMGTALGHEPASFIGPCNCLNPPLRLGPRTAETMLQRARYHAPAMMTTMTNIGGTGPVDMYGSVVLATAEIVGGQILALIVDPDAAVSGYTATTQLDMLTGNLTESTPQTVRVDAATQQLIEKHFGGGTRVGGRGYITAEHPGLQALFERFLKAVGYSAYVDGHVVHYAGTGNLNNGSVMSAEQYLLDLEVMEALDDLFAAPPVPVVGEVVSRLREGILEAEGNFLGLDHTLKHFRDALWEPRYFQRLADTRAEADIVARCHADYLHRIEHYEPASQPPDVVRELESILDRARRDLLG